MNAISAKDTAQTSRSRLLLAAGESPERPTRSSSSTEEAMRHAVLLR